MESPKACRSLEPRSTFHNISRDPSTCFATSVSGMSVQIDREHPDVLTRAWISMPARSLSFPLLMGGSITPLPLLDGAIDEVGRSHRRAAWAWEPVEALALQHLSLVENQVRKLLSADRRVDAARVIDQWVMATTAAHLAVLCP